MPEEAVDLSTRACWSTAAGGLVAPLLGRWRPSSEHARGRCAPACSSALPPRAPLARTAHHRRSCCVRARRIVPPEARATRGLHHSQSSMMEGMMPPAAPPPGARVKGTVSRWTERGFGFITPEDGGEDLFCHFSNVEDVDFLLVSTAYLREPWCACSAMPAHAAPAALGLRVPALLGVCCALPTARVPPLASSRPLFACACGSDDADSDKPHGSGDSAHRARAPRRLLARAPRHARRVWACRARVAP